MPPSIDSSQARPHVWTVFLPFVSLGPSARAASVSVPVNDPSRELAFARYTTSHAESDSFKQSGPVGLFIEASLPELYKSAAVLAVRKQGEDKRSELHVLQIAGDGTVADEVIERFFALRQKVDILPLSFVAITPTNYKFRYAGEVKPAVPRPTSTTLLPRRTGPGCCWAKYGWTPLAMRSCSPGI
jgi:hypothetical protein